MSGFRYNSVLAILFLFSALGCSEEDPEPAPAIEIEITKSPSGAISVVAGAVVKLYGSFEDFSRMQNPVAEMKTDKQGIAIFRNLKQIDYYWSAQSGCLTNYYDRFSTRVPLSMNTQPKYTSRIAETGYVSILNKTPDRYDVIVGTVDHSIPSASYTAEPNSSRNYILPSTQMKVSYANKRDSEKDGLLVKTLACGEHWIVEITN